MANPFKIEIDGVDRSGFVIPESIEVVRNLQDRKNTASFIASRVGAALTYYESPATLPGIVAWWHMDEASGNLADAGGGGLTLTAQGSPTGYGRGSLAPGYGGHSILFDGSDDRFTSTAAGLRFAPPLTVGGWIKPVVASSAFPFVMAGSASSPGTDGFQFGYEVASGDAHLFFIADTVFEAAAPLLYDGRAHHVAVTFSAGFVVRIYFDGEQIGTTTDTNGLAGTTTFALGGDADIPIFLVNGRMDEWFLSNQVLSAAVIRDLYAQGREAANALQLDDLSEVVIRNDDDTARFGGYVVRSKPFREGGLTVAWEAKCVGWEHRFQSILVSYAQSNKRTDEIINEIFAADPRLAAYSLGRVRQGRVVAAYIVQDKPLAAVLDQLADIDGYQWYITPDGDQLVYRRLSMEVTAPWFVSDRDADIAAGAVVVTNMDYDRDMFDPASRVIVRGASDLEDWNPKGFPNLNGNGPIDSIGPNLIPREGDSVIRIQLNEGSGASPVWGDDLVVGLEDFDTLVTEVDVFEVDTTQINGLQAVGAGTTSITVDSTADFPSAGFFRVGLGGVPFKYTSKDATHFLGCSSHFRGNLADNATVYNVSSGVQAVYSPSKGRIRWDDWVRPPNITAYDTAFRVYAQRRKSIRVEVRDSAAERRLGSAYEKLIVDDNILSRASANARARTELKLSQRPRDSLTFTVEVDVDTPEYKLQPGHLLHAVSEIHGFDTYSARDEGSDGFVCRQITSHTDEGGQIQYHDLVLGTWPRDEIDWAMEIRARLDKVTVKDFWDDFEPVLSLDSGWGGDASDTEGVLKFTRPVTTIEP